LLVVIGIIALLISILLPALSRARSAALEVKCLANLKSLGQAAMLHAHDHRGFFPVAGAIWAPATSATPAGLQDSKQQHYVYFTDGSTQRPMPLAGALAAYLGQEVHTDSSAHLAQDMATGVVAKMFLCPADGEGHPGITIAAAVGGGWSGPISRYSYAFNEPALGWSSPGSGSGSPINRARGNLSSIRHASETLFLCDGLPRTEFADDMMDFYDHRENVTLGDVSFGNEPAGTPSIFDKKRHRGRINVGFMDGHAQTLPLEPGFLKQVSLNKDFQ
jgi:prepilin-type processing-associated H-X9-DG protein